MPPEEVVNFPVVVWLEKHSLDVGDNRQIAIVPAVGIVGVEHGPSGYRDNQCACDVKREYAVFSKRKESYGAGDDGGCFPNDGEMTIDVAIASPFRARMLRRVSHIFSYITTRNSSLRSIVRYRES